MKLRREGNAIYFDEFSSPDLVVAEFTDDLTTWARKEIIANHNYGSEMLEAYWVHRGNMHIANVLDLIKRLEEIYHRYDAETFKIRRAKT